MVSPSTTGWCSRPSTVTTIVSWVTVPSITRGLGGTTAASSPTSTAGTYAVTRLVLTVRESSGTLGLGTLTPSKLRSWWYAQGFSHMFSNGGRHFVLTGTLVLVQLWFQKRPPFCFNWFPVFQSVENCGHDDMSKDLVTWFPTGPPFCLNWFTAFQLVRCWVQLFHKTESFAWQIEWGTSH